MDICNTLIVDILKKINGSRKRSGIYYILTGKKTSQSLTDSQWFGIEPYYAALKGMSLEEFNDAIHELHLHNLIESNEENVFVVTQLGDRALEDVKERFSFLKKLNGLKYASIEQVCWQVIALYCQALSNALYSRTDYSPIVREREAIERVKTHFPRSDQKRYEAAAQLFYEIQCVLKESDQKSADIFVRKLSGYNRIGNTFEQLSRELYAPKTEIILRFRSVLHDLLSSACDRPQAFPIVNSLIGIYTDVPPLTRSASLTYQLLKKDKDIQEIMSIRKLKSSTLEDHLVEIARAIPDFSIFPYISEEETEQVIRFYKMTRENKLRPIKEAFPHLSYLQIRLVLAKEGGKNAAGSSA